MVQWQVKCSPKRSEIQWGLRNTFLPFIFMLKIIFLGDLPFFSFNPFWRKKYFLLSFRMKTTAWQIVFQMFNFSWNRWKVITCWWDFLNRIFIPRLREAEKEKERRDEWQWHLKIYNSFILREFGHINLLSCCSETL